MDQSLESLNIKDEEELFDQSDPDATATITLKSINQNTS